VLALGAVTAPVTAGSGDRTLWLYHTHTHETGKFTFKHNGQYDQKVLEQLNIFLADWRTHRPTHMDPHLFDLLWEVYQEVGATQPYNIVSSYREPVTNAMLRSRSANSGVAENSQHMLGKAMDVFIPGVPLPKLRAAAMRHQVGGVGYYPTSGSPFVHMDTGSVRAWPRMTRAQLKTVFPDGKTLHLPVDGKPLSDSGRQYAMAEWKECHMVPCTPDGSVPPSVETDDEIRLAALDPAERSVPTIAIQAPSPMMRPGTDAVQVASLGSAPTPFATNDPNAIVPFTKTASLLLATHGSTPIDGESALSAITDNLHSPAPATPAASDGDDRVLTAYAPEATPDPGAQQALRTLIARATATTAAQPARAAVDTTSLRTASRGGTNGLDVMKNIFDMTWSAMDGAGSNSKIANTLTNSSIDPRPMVGLKARVVDLVAPEIDHVNETLATPIPMTDIHYADMYQPEGYLDNSAELGPLANSVGLEPDTMAPAAYNRFVRQGPLLVASR